MRLFARNATALSTGLTVLFAAALGALLGATMTAYRSHRSLPVLLVDDPGTDLPVVRIDGIENGALVGSVEGRVRLSAGEEMVAVHADGRFAIADRAILVNRITVSAPPGMRFVASSKGTKYYPVDSAGGQNIIPANRVYFATDADATAAGYRK